MPRVLLFFLLFNSVAFAQLAPEGFREDVFTLGEGLTPWEPVPVPRDEVGYRDRFFVVEFPDPIPPGLNVVIDQVMERDGGVFYRLSQIEDDGAGGQSRVPLREGHYFEANQFNQSLDVNSMGCHSCRRAGFGALCDIEDLTPHMEGIASSMANVRSPAQVDLYINCHLSNASEVGDGLTKYWSEYRNYIRAASEAYGIPIQLMQCALLKESKYNSEVENSPAGALGMCQIMPDRRDTIDRLVREGEELTAEVAQFRRELETGVREDYGIPLSWDDSDDTGPYRVTRVRNYEQFLGWETYFNNDFYLERHDVVPGAFSNTGVFRPENCIGAAGMIFMDGLQNIGATMNETGFNQVADQYGAATDSNAAMNLMLLMGASYNAGGGRGGTGGRAIRSADPPTLAQMVAAVEESGNDEAAQYIESLRNCLTPGNYDPPARWYEEGDTLPNCNNERSLEDDFGAIGGGSTQVFVPGWPE